MKISRAMISSLSCPCISAETGRPDLASCEASASMRALGTGWPLTMARFCAMAGRARLRTSAVSAGRRKGFMGSSVEGQERLESFNREGMYAPLDENLQRIIHKAVTSHSRQAGKTGTGDSHPKMGPESAAVGSRMARMRLAFVDYFEAGRRQEFREVPAHRVRCH